MKSHGNYPAMAAEQQVPEALERYFDHLADDEFEAAARQFTEDCEYFHPPNFRDEVTVEGREELYRYFAEERGAKDIDHSFEKVVVQGDKCGMIGRLTGEDIGGEDFFVSYSELEDGKISYYMAGLLKGRVE